MKIYGDIFLNGVKQTTKDIFDLNVEHSFTPNNLWYLIFNEGTTSKKKLNYKSFSFHKIQNVLYGYINFNHLKFEMSMVIYTNGDELVKEIIKCNCHENPNYRFKKFDSLENYWWQLVDLDELKSLSEFEKKTNIECFKKLMEEHYSIIKDSIYYNIKFDFYEPSDSPKIFNSFEFLNYIEEDSL